MNLVLVVPGAVATVGQVAAEAGLVVLVAGAGAVGERRGHATILSGTNDGRARSARPPPG